MTNTAKKPKIKDLDADARAIYNLLWGPHGSPGLTWTEISEALQMSKQRIGAAFWELEIYGLAEPAVTDLTKEQRHVLYTLPPKEDGRSVTYEELAEQVGMDVQTVEECMRVLDEKGWICDPDEKTREEG